MLLKNRNKKNNKGFAALFMVVLVLSIMFGIGVSIVRLTLAEQKILRDAVGSSQAYYAAEAGIEDAVYRIKKIKNIFPNYQIPVSNGQADVWVNSPNQNTKIVTVAGQIANTFREIEAKLQIDTILPQFFYGAQVGTFGIEMDNNSKIEGSGGVPGNVYSNGPIDGDSGATITGDVFVATGMSEDQVHAVYNDDQIFGQNNPLIDIAQSFEPGVSDKLVKVSIYIKKIGDPGDRPVRILTDSGGSPSKTSLASATLQSSLVGTSYGWVDIVFPTPTDLTQGATYWLAIDATRDSGDYWSWGKDKNQGYGNGQGKYTQDWNAGAPVWTSIAGDLNFKTFMGGQATFLRDVVVKGDAHANTIENSKVCGSAFYQAIDSFSLDFLNDPSNPTCPDPLTPGVANPASQDPPLQNMPISDSNINQWKQEATDGGIYGGDMTISSSMSYGPKKIDGNLFLTSNNKTLTITGTIYITGYIDISNGSRVRCDSSYGQNSCIVLTDKWIHTENNGVFEGSGSPGSYVMLLSASNCDGTFSAGCTHHNAAMDLHNGATGAIFYANDGLIFLHNGVNVSELTAKKIHLENNAVITYEQGLANASFSSGPGASWELTSWKEIE